MSEEIESEVFAGRTLNAEGLVLVYDALDAELAGSDHLKILVVGGAAVIPQWMHRGTTDVDVISKSLTSRIKEIIAQIGSQQDLQADWLNDAAKISVPKLDPKLATVYEGDNLTVYVPDNVYLLSMKLFAARDKDFEDAVLLARDTGIVETVGMLDLLERAWPKHLLELKHQIFAEAVAEEVELLAGHALTAQTEVTVEPGRIESPSL